MAGAIVAPEAVGLGTLGVSFILLCFCIVAFGMVKFSTLLVQAIHFVISQTIGRVPLVGSIVGAITGPVFAAVERGLADAAIGVEGAIGFYWHGMATVASWTARELRSHALLIWHLANYAMPWEWGRILVREIGQARHAAALAYRLAATVLHRLGNLERTFVHRVDAAVLPRFTAIEHEIGRVIYPDIAALRARTRVILDRLDATWHRVRGIEGRLTTAALTGAVAVALTALDLNWIRCRNWRRLGRHVCGIPFELLDALLAVSIEALAIADLCDLAGLMTATAEQLRPAMLAFVDVEAALVGCHGASAPPDWPTAVLHLPPRQPLGLLAA